MANDSDQPAAPEKAPVNPYDLLDPVNPYDQIDKAINLKPDDLAIRPAPATSIVTKVAEAAKPIARVAYDQAKPSWTPAFVDNLADKVLGPSPVPAIRENIAPAVFGSEERRKNPDEPQGVVPEAGKFLHKAGQLVKAGYVDLGGEISRWLGMTKAPADVNEEMENIQAALHGAPLPADQLMESQKNLQRWWYKAGGGLAESSPKMALAGALGPEAAAEGIPPIIGQAAKDKALEMAGTGVIFGTNEKGFDPVEGAIMAALPVFHSAGGKLAEMVLKTGAGQEFLKLAAGEAKPVLDVALNDSDRMTEMVLRNGYRIPGVTPESIKSAARFIGSAGASQLYLDAVATVQAMGLPPEQRVRAIQDAFAQNLSLVPLSLPELLNHGGESAPDLTDEQVVKAAKVAKLVNASMTAPEGVRAKAMEQATKTAAANGIKINFVDNLPDGERFDFTKPPVKQQSQEPETAGPRGRSIRLLKQPEATDATDTESDQGSEKPQRSGADEVGETSTETGGSDSLPGATGQPAQKPVTPQAPAAEEPKAIITDAAVDTNPTEAQKKAGNYKMAHMEFHGLDITIENPAGSVRAGTDANGKPWSVKMPAHYGYIKRTEGKDGDHVDVYVGPDTKSESVYVVDQKPVGDRTFDEHKVMLGFSIQAAAENAYKDAFSDGRGIARIKSVTATTINDFKDWLKNGDQSKPFADWQKSKGGEKPNEQTIKEKGRNEEGRTEGVLDNPPAEAQPGAGKVSDLGAYVVGVRYKDGKFILRDFESKQNADFWYDQYKHHTKDAVAVVRSEPGAGETRDSFLRQAEEQYGGKFKITWGEREAPIHGRKFAPGMSENGQPKAAWQIPLEKFATQTYEGVRKNPEWEAHSRATHRREVQMALNAGKEVPPEVLKDYPGMVAEKPAEKKPSGRSIRTPKAKTETPAPVKGEIGGMASPGQVLITTSGRRTTPFPTANATTQGIRKVEKWLQENAYAEAESRGDEYNASMFLNEKPTNKGLFPQASKDSMEQYLFGEQPKVVPSILKPFSKPIKDLTFDEFEKQYRDAYAQMQKYKPTEVGSQHWAAKMAELSDAHPEWADAIERKTDTKPVIGGTKQPKSETKPAFDHTLGSSRPLTPAQATYVRVKQDLLDKGIDALLATRMGDFFEFFGDDAKKAAEALGIAVTKRNEVPMAGVPYHAAQGYWDRLKKRGHSVVLLENGKVTKPDGWDDGSKTETAPQPATKEPWQMTSKEFRSEQIKGQPEHVIRNSKNLAADFELHKDLVNDAVNEGKPVPQEVLDEYPDLQTQAQILQRERERAADFVKGGRGAKLPAAEEVKSPLANLSAEDQAEAERLKKELADLLREIGMNVDPRIMVTAVKLGNLYVKGGIKTFDQFARQVKKEMPSLWEQLKAYLRNVWNQISDMLGLAEVTRAEAEALYAELDKPAEKPTIEEDNANESTESTGSGGRPGGSEPAITGGNGDERPAPANDQRPGEEVQPPVRNPNGKPKGGRGGSSGGAVSDADGLPGESEPTADDAGTTEQGGSGPSGILKKPAGANDLEGIRGNGQNLRLTQNPAPTGPAARIKANIDAIALIRKLETENRQPTHDEIKTLAAWSGWGSFKEIFNDARAEKRDWDPGWMKKYGRAYDQIKKLLTPAEFMSGAESSVNAHYTSQQVVDFAWKAAQRLGFTGGRVLEPSAGSGVFIGYAPDSVANNSAFTAIEMDTITGKILGYLYPRADVKVQGFQDAKLPNGYYDLAISNVPFHQTGPGKEYPDLNLHNYFIARMLDKTRPGGLVIAITTHNTMESAQSQRDLLRDKGQLVGAIRLPNNAFKESADTEVVTDMLFLRKPDGKPFTPEKWQHQVEVGRDENNAPIKANEYFRDHPDMVLGKHALTGTMYRKDSYTVEGTGPLQPKLDEALKRLPENVMNQPTEEQKSNVTTELEDYSLVLDGKHIREAHNNLLHPPEWAGNSTFTVRAKQYIGLRDVLKKQYQLERDPMATDEEIEANRKTLKATYDRWVRGNGTFQGNDRKVSFLRTDPDFYTVLGLENVTEQKDPNNESETLTIVSDADVLSKRVILPDVPPDKSASASDALGVSLAYKGTLDIDYISQLTGLSKDAIEADLIGTGEAYKNPESGALETTQVYLTGDVRDKLAKATFAAKESDKFQRNVEALKKVIPENKPFSSIKLTIAARWVPVVVSNRFAEAVMKLPEGVIKFIPGAEEFSVANVSPHKLSNAAKTQWSTHDLSATSILAHAMNMKQARITRPTGEKGKYETDVNATTIANQMIEKVKDEFEKYIRTTDDKLKYRIFNQEVGEYQTDDLPVWDILEREFNKRHNSFVVPDFDGSKLRLPGLSQSVRRTPHLLNGVARALNAGSAVFAHGVGSGKTFLEIVASYELQRVGLAKKAVLSVKKPTVAQFRVSIERAYPGSKVLIPNEKDFQKENRRALISRIASGRYDFVVLSHEQVRSIRPSEGALQSFYEDQIEQLMKILRDMGAEKHADAKSTRGLDPDVKSIVQKIKSLKKRMDEQLTSMRKKQDTGLHWEDLGIDCIFVDEAHNFKRMPIVTGMENVKGIPSDFSQRAVDLIIKARDIQKRTNGRNVFFASGTPVSNTLAELWVMFHATNPQLLKDFSLQTFDNFATAFADTVTEFELGWDNKFKDVTRMSRFKNGGALSLLTQMGMDVKIGNKELGLDVPEMENGKPNVVVIKNHPAFQRWNAFLEHVSAEWEGMSKKERFENSWVPIATMRAGAAAALDPRCVFPDAEDHPDSKVNTAIRHIFKEWSDGKEDRTTMMVFADMYRTLNTEKLVGVVGHPENKTAVDQVESEDGDAPEKDQEAVDEAAADEAAFEKNAVGDFNLYNDIRTKLVKLGVPEHEIGIITEHDTDAKREALFNKVRNGIVRVLMGGTEKIGEGVDVPQRMSAQFHLDPPMQMTPAKMEQRLGRIIRQGNLHSPKNWNKPVRVNLYAQERSMDGPIYQMLESKGKMVLQALRGQFLGDEFEDPASELTMAMAEMKAAATGDTRVLEMAKLQKVVRDLKLKEGAHYRRLSDLKREVDSAERSAATDRAGADRYKKIADEVSKALAKGDENITMQHLPAPAKEVGEKAIDAWLEKERPGFEAKLTEVDTKAQFPLRFGDVRVQVEGDTRKDWAGTIKTTYTANYWVGGPERNWADPSWDSQINSIESVLTVLKGIPKHASSRVEQRLAAAAKADEEAKAFKEELAKMKFDQGPELEKAEAELKALENILRPPPPPPKKEDKPPGNNLSLSGISDDVANKAIEQFKAENPNAPDVIVTDNSFLIKNNRGVQGDVQGGKIRINRAFITSHEDALAVMREEYAHTLLDRPEVQKQLLDLAGEIDAQELQTIREQYGPDASDADIINEWGAKLNREKPSLWQRFLDAVKNLLRKLFNTDVAPETIVRSILEKEKTRVTESDVPTNRQSLTGQPLEEAGHTVSNIEGGDVTEVLGREDTIRSRDHLTDAVRAEGADHAKALFAKAGLQVVQQENGLFELAAPEMEAEIEGRKLLQAIRQEIAEQNTPGKHTGYLANLLNSVVVNMTQDDIAAFSPQLKRDLYAVAQGERSHRGLLLGALAGFGNTVSYVGRNIDVVLNRVYSDAFGGDKVRQIIQKVVSQFRSYFTDDEIAEVFKNHPDLQGFVNKVIAARSNDQGGRIYRKVQALMKPKAKKTLAALEDDARVQEAVQDVLDQLKAQGVEPKPNPNKKLSPLDRLLHMVEPNTAAKIDTAVAKAIAEAERNAGITATLKEANSEQERQELQDNFDAGEEPSPDMIEKGLQLGAFAHWRVLRDNILGYSPVTVKLAQDLVKADFRGTRFGPPSAKLADTRINLDALAKQPEAEVERVINAYVNNLNEHIALAGADPETRHQVADIVRQQVEQQLEKAREKVRSPMFAEPKDPKAGKTAEQRAGELLNAGLFRDPQLDIPGMVERVAAKSAMQKLTPSLPELVKSVLQTPFYAQADLRKNFVSELISKLGVPEDQAEEAGKVFEAAFKQKFDIALERAKKSALELLTPKERAAKFTPDKPLWKRVTEAVNSGVFDSGEVLKKIAADNGWTVPTDAKIANIKGIVEQMERLFNLTPKEKADAGTDPATIDRALYEKRGRNMQSWLALKKKVETEFHRLTNPMTLRSMKGAQEIARGINDLVAANILLKFTFGSHLGIDVLAQMAIHTPTRAIAEGLIRNREAIARGEPGAAWNEVSSAVGQAYAQRAKVLKMAFFATAKIATGSRDAAAISNLMNQVSFFDRTEAYAQDLHEKGGAVNLAKAAGIRVLNLIQFSFKAAQALHNLQSIPLQTQEMHARIVTDLRANGMNKAQAEVNADTVIGDVNAEWASAIGQVEAAIAQEGRTASKAQIKQMALDMVRNRQLWRIKQLGLPADEMASQNDELSRLNGWALPEKGGAGAILRNIVVGAKTGLEKMGIPSLGIFNFGNALGIACNRVLTFTGLGRFPGLFKGSPWFEGERNQQQRKVEANAGLAVMGLLAMLMAAGLLRYRRKWPQNEADREQWKREGRKPNVLEIVTGPHSFIPISASVGPMWMMRPILGAGGALQDLNEERGKKQKALDAEAKAKGLTPGKIAPLSAMDYVGVAAAAAWEALIAGRAGTGALSAVSSYGKFDPNKALANSVSVAVPFLPMVQEISQLAGINIDPKLASVMDFVWPFGASDAVKHNMLGDAVTNESDIERIGRRLTGGTWSEINTSEADPAYAVMFNSGYRPPSINPDKGYAINGELRPLTSAELAKYTDERATNLKRELSALPASADLKDVQSAYRDANAEALQAIGAEVGSGSTRQTGLSQSQGLLPQTQPLPTQQGLVGGGGGSRSRSLRTGSRSLRISTGGGSVRSGSSRTLGRGRGSSRSLGRGKTSGGGSLRIRGKMRGPQVGRSLRVR